MLNRRDFLARTLQGSTLLALTPTVPEFLANTARAAEAGKETILVVLEMTGGNDGLNTVIPYADPLYHKARPTLGFTKQQVLRVDDHVGLHPALASLNRLLQKGSLAAVQGVGYPNPDRSHFESMDIWQSADVRRQQSSGWIGRSVPDLQKKTGNIPVLQVGSGRLPLALRGAPGGVVSIDNGQAYQLDLGRDPARREPRRKLLEDMASPAAGGPGDDLLQFVRRRQLQTYTTLDRLQEVLESIRKQGAQWNPSGLAQNLSLVARLIERGFGTRVFYATHGNFDTHSGQAPMHEKLLRELGDAVNIFFDQLERSGHAKRVLLMTFSEFGRRVQENGSKGTDHGAASCLFVAGPAVKAGAVGKHPSLADLDSGDLKHHTDFRQVYATLLDGWLGCDSRAVLGDSFRHIELLKQG
jgi:uncharacterized protein (DUF1501 family)